jgi:hypothetical protein
MPCHRLSVPILTGVHCDEPEYTTVARYTSLPFAKHTSVSTLSDTPPSSTWKQNTSNARPELLCLEWLESRQPAVGNTRGHQGHVITTTSLDSSLPSTHLPAVKVGPSSHKPRRFPVLSCAAVIGKDLPRGKRSPQPFHFCQSQRQRRTT